MTARHLFPSMFFHYSFAMFVIGREFQDFWTLFCVNINYRYLRSSRRLMRTCRSQKGTPLLNPGNSSFDSLLFWSATHQSAHCSFWPATHLLALLALLKCRPLIGRNGVDRTLLPANQKEDTLRWTSPPPLWAGTPPAILHHFATSFAHQTLANRPNPSGYRPL